MSDRDFVVKNGLVVNTNALVVDGATNQVGVNTASPDAAFSVIGTANVSGNVTLSSNLSVMGNTYIHGRFEVVNNAYIDKKLYVGNTATMIQDLPTIIQAVDNFNGFVMISSQNLSRLDDACADLITYADNTNGLSHFNDIGINNSRFDGTIHRIITNATAGSWQLNETVYQKNNAGANIAVGVIRDIVSINATAVSLKISVSEDDGLQTYVGISDFVPTVGANLSLRGVTSAANSDILFAVPFFSPAANTLSRRNYGFTVGKRGDGYLYNANSALTIGTTFGGLRTTEYSLSLSAFISGQTTIELSSGDTDLLYADMVVTGTGIPPDAYIRSIANSTAFVLSKATTAGSSGPYVARDPYYDSTGNPIIFHVNGMMAKDEVGRFNGNGNFTIGANSTARNSKLTVGGTANITGAVTLGNDLAVTGNVSIAGNVTSNVNFDGGVLFVDSVNNRVGIKNTSPDAELTVTGNANVSGDLNIGGDFVVAGSISYVGTFQSTGDINPLSNNFNLGNTSSLWNLVGNNVAVSNVTVGANVIANTTSIKVGTSSYYTYVTNNLIETTGSLSVKGTSTLVGAVTVGNTAIGDNVSIVVTGTDIKFGNNSVNAVINSTSFNGTALYATNPANASSLSSGTVPAARLPTGNATHIGGLQLVNSLTNTSITITASANNVKTAYDSSIDANTRASSAQTAAIAAYSNAIAYSGNAALAFANAVANAASYSDTKSATAYSNAASYADTKAATAFSNAVSYADSRIIDSVTNTYITYAASANTVKNAYDRAISANTRAASAQTAAIAAYSNAVSYTDDIVASYALKSGAAFTGAVSMSNILTVTASTASTSKTTGATVITGGLGVGGAINAGGDITAYATSDNRLKTNIENIPDALSKVMQLNGVSYNWNNLAQQLYDKDTGVKEVGIIAQEVDDVLPEVVTTRENGYMAVRYEKLVPLLIEAIKELKAEIETLKSKV